MEQTPTPLTTALYIMNHAVTSEQEILRLKDERAMLREALAEAGLQIDYLQDKFFATGTSAAVLARISAALEATK